MAIPTAFMVDKFKPMKITKVDVVFADKPGRNRNIYSTAVLKEAIVYYKKLIALDPTYKYSFAKHPKDSDEEWIGLIAAAIDDIYFNDAEGTVQADFTLLPTIWGQFIAWLLSNEYHVGISLRGKAESQPSSIELGGNTISVNQRFNLKLEGVDFVVYPSYIVTNASKANISEKSSDESVDALDSILPSLCRDNTMAYSEVLENFIKDTSTEYGILTEDIKTLLTIPVNKNVAEETLDMDELQVREAQVQVDRLSVEKDKLSAEIASLKKELEQNTLSADEKKVVIADLDAKISNSQQIVTGLSQLEERLNAKKEELAVTESKIDGLNTNYEKLTAEYQELNVKAENQSTVRIAGKLFTSDAPPKIRVIESSEKTTNADWNLVDASKIVKLVALTNNETLNKQVFAVSEGTLSCPVYQAFQSTSTEHDIDLVLNNNALQATSDYLVARESMSMSAAQKMQAVSFLHTKYTELETAGISEIPEFLKDVSARSEVLSKIKFDEPDAFTEAVIESAVFNGMVLVTPKEKVTEGSEEVDDTIMVSRAVAYDNIAAAISNTILGINKGTLLAKAAKVTEMTSTASMGSMMGGAADDGSTATSSDDPLSSFIDTLITSPDGSPTDFSDAFGIQNQDDFMNKFIGPLNDSINSDNIMIALGMIQMAVSTFTQAMVDASDDTNVSDYITAAFQAIASVITPENDETGEGGNALPDNQNINTGAKNNPVTEQTEIGGDDKMLFDDLKVVLEKRFEGVAINTPEELTKVVEKLVADYEMTFAEMKALEFATAKKDKSAVLAAAGVTEEVISTEITAATTIEELEAVTAKLIAEVETAKTVVTESVKVEDVLDPTATQKSHAVVPPVTVAPDSAGMVSFKKIMGSI